MAHSSTSSATGSVAALASDVVILYTGGTPNDPMLTVLICGLMLFFTLSLLRRVVHTLLEGVPVGLSLPELPPAQPLVFTPRSARKTVPNPAPGRAPPP